MKTKGQTAMEYMLIVAFALVVIIPATFLFYNYSKGSNDELVGSQMSSIGLEILDSSERMFIGGEHQWETLKFNLPDQFKEMYILDYSELVIEYYTQTGTSQAVFFSDIEIRTENCTVPSLCTFSFNPGYIRVRVESKGDYVLLKIS
ncbi:MAG: hypothetical protein ABIE94_06825 [archaeon]